MRDEMALSASGASGSGVGGSVGSPLVAGALPLRCAVPIDRWLAMASGRPLPERSRGVALVADISGFTALTNRLTSTLGSKPGSEALSALVTSVFDGLAEDTHRHGGSTVGIAGDAVSCWFDERPMLAEGPVPPAAARAQASAAAMQRRLHQLEVAPAPDGAPAGVSLRVGLAGGEALRFLVGDPELRVMDMLAGAPVVDAAAACRRAAPGEVVTVGEPAVAATSETAWPRMADGAVPDQTLARWHHPTVLDHLRRAGWLPGELRRAAIVFAGLAEMEPGASDLPATVGAAVRTAQGVLARHGGTLIDIALDEKGLYLAAVVGAPIAFPDQARRAADAALDLSGALSQAGAGGPARIGIAEGRVWAGMSGTRLRAAYVVRGDPVNLAARLMENAGPGQVVAGPAIARALRDSHSLERHGDLVLKGWEPPVASWLVLAASPNRVAAPALPPPLVGRAAELGRVAAAMAVVEAGGSRVVAISGEPGIGKSRLLEAATAQARDAGLRVLVASGNAVEQSVPYRAWAPVFEALLGLRRGPPAGADLDRILRPLGEDGRDRAALLGAILPVAPAETETTRSMSPEARQESTQWLLTELFRAHRGTGPALLVMDDAQWLDSASWALLLRLARSGEGLLLLVAARAEDAAGGRLGAVLGISGAQGMELSPLAPRDALEAVCAALGVAELPKPVARLVADRAEGNPFFAEELVYALRDAGLLEVGGDGCRLAPGADLERLEFPATVEGVISNRVDRLPPEAQAALKVGSVLALPFTAGTISTLAGGEPESAAQLAELEARDLIVSDGSSPDPSYTFKHALIRDVVYDRLLGAQRRVLHQRAAEHYERAAPLPRGLLAHHWEQAGVVDKALDNLELAGQDALRDGAFTECAGLLGRALGLADGATPPVRRARWRWQAAQAYYRLGDLARSRDLAEQAVAVFDRPLPASGAALPVALAGQAIRQLLHRVFGRPVLSRLGPADAGRLLPAARAYFNLAEVDYLASRKARSAYAALRGLNIAELAGPSLELAEAYGAIGIICGLVGRQRLAARYLALGFQVADRLGVPYGRAILLHQASLHRSGVGDFEHVFAYEQEAAELFRRLGDKGRFRDCLAIAGVAAEQAGRLDLAERLMADLLATREGEETFLQEIWASTWLGAVASRRGRPDQALDHLRRAAAIQGSALRDATAVTFHGEMALALWQTGQAAQAGEEADRARAVIAKAGGRPTVHAVLDGYAALAEVSLGLWDSAANPAERDLWRGRTAEACRFLRTYSRVFPIGEPARWLFEGQRQARLDHAGRAVRAWRRSLAAAERLNMTYELQRARHALGMA